MPTPLTEQWLKKQRVWQHNSYSGHISMSLQNMRTIAQAKTCTLAARRQAEKVIEELIRLQPLLKTRID